MRVSISYSEISYSTGGVYLALFREGLALLDRPTCERAQDMWSAAAKDCIKCHCPGKPRPGMLVEICVRIDPTGSPPHSDSSEHVD